MTSPVDLANAALLRCSTRSQITSLTDGSMEALACNAFINDVITRCLSARPWRFARRVASVAPQASSNPSWANEFVKPADVVAMVAVLDKSVAAAAYDHRQDFAQQGVEFEEGSSGAALVVWAQPAAVSLLYTTSALTIDQWPAAFRELVTWSLAAEIALPITSNGELAETLGKGASDALTLAIAKDAPPGPVRRLTVGSAPPPLASDVGLVNAALFRMGAKAVLSSLSDGSPVANAASSILPYVMSSCLTAQPWRFATRIGALTAAASSSNPAWVSEFIKPADCLKTLAVLNPNQPPSQFGASINLFSVPIPFEEGIGSASGTPGPVLWADLPAYAPAGDTPSLSLRYTSAALTYTQLPAAFLQFVAWRLAAELAVSGTEMLDSQGQAGTALTGIRVAQAMEAGAERARLAAMEADSPRVFQGTDYVPDWMAVRGLGPEFQDWRITDSSQSFSSGYAQDLDQIASSQGAVPTYLEPVGGLFGVPSVGIQAAMIGGGERGQYIPAYTPDGRIGRFAIGTSPLGWRRPYHDTITVGQVDGIGTFAVGDAIDAPIPGEVETP